VLGDVLQTDIESDKGRWDPMTRLNDPLPAMANMENEINAMIRIQINNMIANGEFEKIVIAEIEQQFSRKPPISK